MVSIRYKWGGTTWSAPVANGKLWTKWGGGWFVPTKVSVKTGSTADALAPPYGGTWLDTGYKGYPATPASLFVNAWTYSTISLGWTAGTGGAPATTYNLVQTDTSGNWLNQVETAGSPWGNFSMSWDTNYYFYVRAKSAAGLYSPFNGPLKVHCGHPQQDTYGNVQHNQAWSASFNAGTSAASLGYRDNLCGPAIGSDILVDRIYWDLYCSQGSMSPYNNRTVQIILNESFVWKDPADWQVAHLNANDYPSPYWGNTGRTGFICRGSGWSSNGTNGYPRIWGTVIVYGQQYYTRNEVISTIPAQANYTY